MQSHPDFGVDIDFKLAKSQGALNALSTQETGFDSLQITICKARPVPAQQNYLQGFEAS